MLPNYMQIWGVAKNHGLNVKTFHLREESGWAPDLDELNEAVTPGHETDRGLQSQQSHRPDPHRN